MEKMVSANYPGGLIRVARDDMYGAQNLFELSKKKQACITSGNMLSSANITESTKKIAAEIYNNDFCKLARLVN
jgi:hypothetical protein